MTEGVVSKNTKDIATRRNHDYRQYEKGSPTPHKVICLQAVYEININIISIQLLGYMALVLCNYNQKTH